MFGFSEASLRLITDRILNLLEGNVFSHVYLSVCLFTRGGGPCEQVQAGLCDRGFIYGVYTSIGRRVVGLQLKGFLV